MIFYQRIPYTYVCMSWFINMAWKIEILQNKNGILTRGWNHERTFRARGIFLWSQNDDLMSE